jgi:hypothetical protein
MEDHVRSSLDSAKICEDWVMFGSSTGARFAVGGDEFAGGCG